MRITRREFNLLRDFIEAQCGIFLGEEKAYLFENRLSGLVEASGCKTFGDFCLNVKNKRFSQKFYVLMIEAMTTNETLWFRDSSPFQIFKEIILPELQEKKRNAERYPIKICSAGCSTGQEPYSIAMTALDFFRETGNREECSEKIKIIATDISSSALALAVSARYDETAVKRGLTPEHIERYFKKDGHCWMLRDNVKKMVTFKQFNLREPLITLGTLDIIFLRNVMIYFSETFKRELLGKIQRILSPGGYLFLGAGEMLDGFTAAFDKLKYKGYTFYRVKKILGHEKIA